MRMSCNGCRVLRKGCSDDCSIRPCLAWIKSPESQAHATVFLAKFYGRAGLLNLINSGPQQLRPAIFRSLLYEACGRIVNPIYGSVGLLWSGKWGLCQEALESVLKGSPITPISPDEIAIAAAAAPPPPPQPQYSSSSNMIFPKSINFNKKDSAYDIRHVIKDPHQNTSSNNNNNNHKGDVHRVRTRTRFKRSSASSNTVINKSNSKPKPPSAVPVNKPPHSTTTNALPQSPSRNSSVSHGDTIESMVSVETDATVSRPHSETIMLFNNKVNKDNDVIVNHAPPLLQSNNHDDDDEQLIHLRLGLSLFSSNPYYTSQSQSQSQSQSHPNSKNTSLLSL